MARRNGTRLSNVRAKGLPSHLRSQRRSAQNIPWTNANDKTTGHATRITGAKRARPPHMTSEVVILCAITRRLPTFKTETLASHVLQDADDEVACPFSVPHREQRLVPSLGQPSRHEPHCQPGAEQHTPPVSGGPASCAADTHWVLSVHPIICVLTSYLQTSTGPQRTSHPVALLIRPPSTPLAHS